MTVRLRVVVMAAGLVAAISAAMPAPASASGGVHCMRPGETLWSVAARYGTTAYAMAHYNGLANPNYVQAGWCLKIPPFGPYGPYYGGPRHGGKYYGGPYIVPGLCDRYPACCAPPVPGWCGGWRQPPPYSPPPYYGGYPGGRYCVRPGDTLFAIGRRFGVSPWAIATANHLANPNYIYIGQCLVIPGYWVDP